MSTFHEVIRKVDKEGLFFKDVFKKKSGFLFNLLPSSALCWNTSEYEGHTEEKDSKQKRNQKVVF